ncbi:hypothetical protein CK203_035723 [Vitis vinifera]|uniref:Uncharacterized protein n=1 Tax=Vitis vinifera TaxID=29760 RepID=A0A438ICR4_VITVI|nr:hypothetical protein CK203_035723 [Vitis vinifera]
MLSLQDIESMMVGIDDIEEFKRVFLISLVQPYWHPLLVWKVVTRYAMYVELTTPRIAAWNDFLVKQRIKLELEMLGGFGKVELVSTSAEQDETEKNKAPTVDDPVDPDENEDFDVICARMEATLRQITDAQSHLNSLIASYNRDVKVLRTRFTSSHYRTDEGQLSNFHEHVNESGAPFYTNNPQHSLVHSGGQRRSFEDDVGCTNEGVSERPNVEDAPQASEEIRPQRVKMKVRRHRQRAAAYALCIWWLWRDTGTISMLSRESFIDIPVISMFCRYMNAKEENPYRRHFFNPYFGEICGSMSKSTSKSTLKKRLGSYCVNLECCNQLLKNSFKRNDVNINNLHPQYADIDGDPKLCHTGMYAILYMQHWDGSGLNRTINSERMSLERLKFATHMVLDSENEIGEMVTANIWSTNDAE